MPTRPSIAQFRVAGAAHERAESPSERMMLARKKAQIYRTKYPTKPWMLLLPPCPPFPRRLRFETWESAVRCLEEFHTRLIAIRVLRERIKERLTRNGEDARIGQ
jgi:hypothetical protein